MKIPGKVKIGGLIFSVERIKNLVRDYNSFGESCGNSQEIRLDADMSEQLTESTFIHEVLHMLDFVYCIRMEHDQVRQLESAILAFIKDNPEIFK